MNADKITIEELLSDESFINYCKGVSPGDIAFWENYKHENPDKALLIEDAKEQYVQLFNALALADLDEQTSRLENSLEQKESTPVVQMEKFEKGTRGKVLPLLLKITAAAIIVAGLFVTINYFVAGRVNNKTYAAVYGERKNIQLPDGSVVTLNAGSNIKINEKYGLTTRDVYLEGEAFFEVKHDRTRPFIVHTPAMDVKALGTAFNVKAYLDEKNTETSLISGLVEVTLKENNNLKMLLYPNQKIEWQNGNTSNLNNNLNTAKKDTYLTDSLPKKLVLTSTGDIKEIAWKENKLIFDDEEFKDIAILLERWYGAKINFKDTAICNYRFTGTYEKEDLNTVLDYLKESRSFNYTIEQGEILTINLSK
ncbi:FecR family protein [Lacibacter sediminis]|uniref:FecR domain-containing protein n=1 Tax=Lacibacter sediminis TaxID=2760713 RepID=A0A7G5XEL4_9BACT|nr:FecR domain-containing protein [Lacibacter sediminis]QNA43917.1 FecR domain-containing protein [Lacibacter sediminis]